MILELFNYFNSVWCRAKHDDAYYL